MKALGLRQVPSVFLRVVVELCILLAVALLCTGPALAAPKAANGQECAVTADMAIVARSIVLEKMDRPKAEAIMRRIYEVDEAHGAAMLKAVLDTAERIDAAPSDYAAQLYGMCMRSQGDMDGILGVTL